MHARMAPIANTEALSTRPSIPDNRTGQCQCFDLLRNPRNDLVPDLDTGYYYLPDEGPKILAVSLASSDIPRPAGTGGVSTTKFTAKVTQDCSPKPGIALGFAVEVQPNSGGHDHHDVSRPKGSLSISQGTTDGNGEVTVAFQAPEVAGVHVLTVSCAACSNTPVTKEVQVKVPNLVEMLPDTAKPPSYTLVGNLTYPGSNHKSNHWFTATAGGVLQKVVDALFETGWGVVGVNDGSLPLGGLFDINAGWKPWHKERRTGTEVYFSFNNPRAITEQQRQKAYDKKGLPRQRLRR